MKFMKLRKLMMSLFISLLFLIPFSAQAQLAVFDGAVYMQTYMNYMQLVSQITVLQQQASYLQQSLNAIKTIGGSDYHWSDVSDKINQLGGVIQQSNGLSYSAQNLGSQFQKAYPGYQAPKDFNQQYQQNINTTMNTLNGSLQSLNMSAADFSNEPKRIAFLQSQVKNAKGQTQAIQASAEISTEVVSQLQLLRQTMMAQSNAQSVYYAQQLQTQASNDAGLRQMLENTDAKPEGYGSSGQYVHVPHS